MSGSSGIPCTVTNQLDTPLIVFNTTAVSAASNPPSTNAPDYDQVYTQIAVVPANGSLTFTSPPMPVRMVIAHLEAGGAVSITSGLEFAVSLWCWFEPTDA
jgi:hypothetical protein